VPRLSDSKRPWAFNIKLGPKHRLLLAALQEETGATSASEVLRHALDLYDALRGCDVFIRAPGEGENGALSRVIVPGLTQGVD